VGHRRCIVGIVRCFEEEYIFLLIVGLQRNSCIMAEREDVGMMLT